MQGTNALLSWASAETETFIVQYRSKLDVTMPWVILTNGLAAAPGTNHTSFLHSGIVEYGTATGGGSGVPPPNPLLQVTQIETIEGQSSILPETSYNESLDSAELQTPIDLPPLPWDPRAVQTDTLSALSLQSLDSLESPQGCIGFYRVVRQGIYVVGFSNQIMLSGSVAFPMEIGCADKTITGISAYVNDKPLIGGSIACNENNQWVFDWDTTCIPNGNYSVYFEAYFVGGGSVSNAPISVTISNAVAFPDYFSRFYGDTLFVYAVLTTGSFVLKS